MSTNLPGASPEGDYDGHDLEALADIPNYQRWILQHFGAHLRGRVLEIGAGIGTYAHLYLDNVDSAVLLEPAKNLTTQLTQSFRGSDKVRIVSRPLTEACEDGYSELQAGSFDAILSINVLEHVDDDLGMLRTACELLRPGGTLLLFVPALGWLYGSLDRLVEHRRRYSLRQLRALLDSARFETFQMRYFDRLGVLPWFITGRILRQRRFSRGAAQVYDRVAVPLGATVERWITPPLGKNLLALARRPLG
jgi:SAM-dependent methyltransferase